jgi:hypothetical protein
MENPKFKVGDLVEWFRENKYITFPPSWYAIVVKKDLQYRYILFLDDYRTVPYRVEELEKLVDWGTIRIR